jgi:hypothetical protein
MPRALLALTDILKLGQFLSYTYKALDLYDVRGG